MIMTVNHVFSALSFISFVVVSVPFAWHLEARNIATCLYISWVSISSLVYFVNSVVWDGNIVDWSPVWCDISKTSFCEFRSVWLIAVDLKGGRITLATNVAVPATCLCIQRRLYHFVLNPVVVSTKAQVRVCKFLRRCVLIVKTDLLKRDDA
jgi:pheromone a factor receptor